MEDEQKLHPARGMFHAVVTFILIVIIPLLLISIIAANYDVVEEGPLARALLASVILGATASILAFLEHLYWKGSTRRLIFGLSKIGVLCGWLISALGGSVIRVQYEGADIQLDISNYILLLALGLSLKGLHTVAVYVAHRKPKEDVQKVSTAKETAESFPQ